MAVTEFMLQEQRDRLDQVVGVLRQMRAIDRISVSQACTRLESYMNDHRDPLIEPISDNPFVKKAGRKKRFFCC